MSYTWDLDTIYAVRRFYSVATISIDAKRLARFDIEEAARHKSARAIVSEAHALGVEVHPHDVHIIERPEQTKVERRQGVYRLVAGWRPKTREVEFNDSGPNDGRLYEVRDPWEPLVVALPLADAHAIEAELYPSTTVRIRKEIYSLAGWREVERRWVFSPE